MIVLKVYDFVDLIFFSRASSLQNSYDLKFVVYSPATTTNHPVEIIETD